MKNENEQPANNEAEEKPAFNHPRYKTEEEARKHYARLSYTSSGPFTPEEVEEMQNEMEEEKKQKPNLDI